LVFTHVPVGSKLTDMPPFLSYNRSSENCNGRLIIVKVRHVISNMGYKDKGVSEKVILKDIRV